MIGRIHSVESCGTVDGPGLRFIVFLQGCSLRCAYCHNPDTWKLSGGIEKSVDELLEEAKGYLPFMKASNGGVTLSGGEPLMQPDFVLEFFKKCKEAGIHTTLDTSGSVKPKNIDDILKVTDLVLLDIKHIKEEKHKEITGLSNKNTLEFAKLLDQKGIPVWIRHVLVPGLSNDDKDLSELGDFLGTLSNIEKVDILPYHKMGEYKWEQLGLTNTLVNVMPPKQADVDKAYNLLTKSNKVVSV
ncbi:pyruvate formate-lyase 1-activating enzyme [Anaerobacillus alkalidiazotrophicus]|uniref:Pyruvate formate-lyase-activating enzyme n=1 Tax=Anaerobacillus alkalidiazotrophicus TaxID=472963 RepID=A0A1S2M6J5_9BACI|nr:pyruvate formate-lyase-activating protein [Anaerobacillus alkalidiazotrophicus]OIJ20321.1 pyruvate formate-lyase 1-activating enzyme [Anaerobacillus alkalidiazotrophicus]